MLRYYETQSKALNNDMNGFKEFFQHCEQGYSDNETIALYLNSPNKRIIEISTITGKSIGELYRILHSNGVKPNRLRTNHHNVIDFASSGMSVQQVAELTGYTPRNVRYILSKLTTE